MLMPNLAMLVRVHHGLSTLVGLEEERGILFLSARGAKSLSSNFGVRNGVRLQRA